jgi:hypothetical protein
MTNRQNSTANARDGRLPRAVIWFGDACDAHADCESCDVADDSYRDLSGQSTIGVSDRDPEQNQVAGHDAPLVMARAIAEASRKRTAARQYIMPQCRCHTAVSDHILSLRLLEIGAHRATAL